MIRPDQPCNAARRLRSFRAASFLSSVFSTQADRPLAPRRCKLPQPQVYLMHIAATPAIRCCSVIGARWEARPLVTVLAVLVRNGRGCIISQEQGGQWNSAQHIGSWSHIQAWSWEGLIKLGHPGTLHRPSDGQFQLLKGAEKDQVVMKVIRAAAVGHILWESPTLGTQVAGEEKLQTSIPTVFQGNIVVNLLSAERIRRDNKDVVLYTTKLEF
jgi:hypothetical protein